MRSLQAIAAAAPSDECISWWARGDIGGGVDRGSLGDSVLRMTLGGHSELQVAALLKVYGGACVLQAC